MGTTEKLVAAQQRTAARLEYSGVQRGRKLLPAEQVFSHLNSTCLLLERPVNKQKSIQYRCMHAGHEIQIVWAQGFPADWNHLTKLVPPGIAIFHVMRRSLPAKTETKYNW